MRSRGCNKNRMKSGRLKGIRRWNEEKTVVHEIHERRRKRSLMNESKKIFQFRVFGVFRGFLLLSFFVSFVLFCFSFSFGAQVFLKGHVRVAFSPRGESLEVVLEALKGAKRSVAQIPEIKSNREVVMWMFLSPLSKRPETILDGAWVYFKISDLLDYSIGKIDVESLKHKIRVEKTRSEFRRKSLVIDI